MSANICIIGAGSGIFSLAMVRDLCLTPKLRGSRVTLVDIDTDRLTRVHALATRYAGELGINLDLRMTTDRRSAMAGAQVVVNAALAAGHQRLRAGWEVARRHGYRWGGSLHVMHDEAYWINFYQLRLFDAIIRDLLEVCPKAYYIQIANPVQAGITHLARTYPGVRVAGLCHGYAGVYSVIEQLGLERERCTFELPGVNHFIWLTKLVHDGRDAMPLIDRWIAEKGPAAWERGGYGELSPKKCDIWRRVGAFPVGDTAGDGGGSWGWWYHADDATEQRWQEKPGRFWEGFFAEGETHVATIAALATASEDGITGKLPAGLSGESVIPMVEALVCDTPRVIISNVPNRGALVPGIPEDYQVEVPVRVSGLGLEGVRTSGLPPAVLAWTLRDCVAPVNLELAAYTQGSRVLLRELIMTDPWTRSTAQADALLDAIAGLPFHGELRDHYH